MKIPLWVFNVKVGWKNIFKPTIRNESLHQDSNDNDVTVVNFATSKNLVTNTMFPHRNIHKYNWNSPDGKTHNQIDHILIYIYIYIYTRWQSSILHIRICRGAVCDTNQYLVVAKFRKKLNKQQHRCLMGKDLISGRLGNSNRLK